MLTIFFAVLALVGYTQYRRARRSLLEASDLLDTVLREFGAHAPPLPNSPTLRKSISIPQIADFMTHRMKYALENRQDADTTK